VETLLAPLVDTRAGEFARELIGQFGSLAQAMRAASPEEAGARTEALQVLGAAQALVRAACAETIAGSTVDALDPALGQHLRLRLGFASEETALAIHIDAAGGYAGEQLLAQGGVGSVPVPIRQIVRRALELGSRSVLLAHNHPSGRPLPSARDYEVTDRLRSALSTVEIGLLDHLVVTRRSVFSMQAGVTT
jgi:DNA repair protein RadC